MIGDLTHNCKNNAVNLVTMGTINFQGNFLLIQLRDIPTGLPDLPLGLSLQIR